jgi:hypothetical protein
MSRAALESAIVAIVEVVDIRGGEERRILEWACSSTWSAQVGVEDKERIEGGMSRCVPVVTEDTLVAWRFNYTYAAHIYYGPRRKRLLNFDSYTTDGEILVSYITHGYAIHSQD